MHHTPFKFSLDEYRWKLSDKNKASIYTSCKHSAQTTLTAQRLSVIHIYNRRYRWIYFKRFKNFFQALDWGCRQFCFFCFLNRRLCWYLHANLHAVLNKTCSQKNASLHQTKAPISLDHFVQHNVRFFSF